MAARRLSVTTAVAATIATVATLLVGAFGIISYRAEAKRQREALRALSRLQANELAVALALPIWNIDRQQIDKVTEAMSRAHSIYGIRVVAAGQVHARIRDGAWNMVPWDGRSAPPGELIVEERPITFAGEQLGTVRLLVTPRFTEEDLKASRLRVVLTILAIDLTLILCTYFILWRTVLHPIVKIERYAASVRAGETRPISSGGEFAELDSLRKSIESMVDLLAARFEELEQLRRTEKMAAMGALVAGVAHEVRNPLFAMSAMLDAYADELRAPDLAEFSRAMREQVTRLTNLMRELLDFGKPVELTAEPELISELIDEVILSRSRAASDARVTLSRDFAKNLPPLTMDHSRLRQVFENLVDNAIQHSPAGGVVTIAASEANNNGRSWIECVVKDNGPGIHSDDLGHIFQPFFTRREGGIGLGLSIVQRIVEEHSGTVSAANRAEGGAVITVRLPVTA